MSTSSSNSVQFLFDLVLIRCFISCRIDPLAWNTLKSVSSKYSLYDSPDLHFIESAHAATNTASNAICTMVSDDEAYVDEWVDYHAAIGFSKIYLFDSTEEHWFQQWGEETSHSAPIEVIHLPGNKTDTSFKANAFAKCIELHQTKHNSMAFLEVNDFIVIPGSDGLDPLIKQLQSSPGCAQPIRRIVFGSAGQNVYDPLPVTKRFMFKVEENMLSPQSVLFVKTKNSTGPIDSMDNIQSDLAQYFSAQRWESSVCPGNASPPSDVVVHHYLRSTKECKKERGNTDLCSLKGTVEDQSAWEKLQKLLPGYSHYNGFL